MGQAADRQPGSKDAQRSRHLFKRFPVYMSTAWESQALTSSRATFPLGLELAGLFLFFGGKAGYGQRHTFTLIITGENKNGQHSELGGASLTS